MDMESIQSPILASSDVLSLITIRNHLPSRIYVSVKGHITAMSEILRMKRNDFFLIELDHLVHILVKDFHLEWHQQLCPLTTVVFHDLRLTTIEKGVAKPQPLLVVWKTSRTTVEPDSKFMPCQDFKEWLSSTPFSMPTIDPPEAEKTQYTNSSKKCHCHKGTVTDISQSGDGIYILDDGIRLFTGFIPPGCFDSKDIREGDTVSIYNAHCLQESENTLVACSRTLIRGVERLASIEASSPSSALKSHIHKYGLNYREAQAVLAWKRHIGESKRNVPKILDNVLKSGMCGELQAVGVSPIDLFIHHEHFCQLTGNNGSRGHIPCVQSVEQMNGSLTHHNKNAKDSHRLADEPSRWSFCHQEWENAELLLGTLSYNGFGQLRFVDKTGNIPVMLFHSCPNEDFNHQREIMPVTATEHARSAYNGNKMTDHCCGLNCLTAVKPKEKCVCPFISQSLIGKIFTVKRYHLVSERFITPLCNNTDVFDKNASDLKSGGIPESVNCSSVTYLMFSLVDCIFLEKASSKTAQSSVDDSSSSSDSAGKNSQLLSQADQYSSHLIYISGKELVVPHWIEGGFFTVTGTLINKDAVEEFFLENSNLSKFHCVHGFTRSGSRRISCCTRKRCTECENCLSCSQKAGGKKGKEESKYVPYEMVHDNNQGCGNGFAVSKQSLENVPLDIDRKSADVSSLHKTQPVTLRVSGAGVGSYPFLNIDKFYNLKIPVREDAFKPEFSNAKVEQTLLRSNSRVFIDVNESLLVEKAVLKKPFPQNEMTALEFGTCRLLTVAEVLKQRASTVSFRGVIQGRGNFTPVFASKGSCTVDDMKLIVGDLEDSRLSMHVYFKSFKVFNVLGLIPGSVVDLHCAERKVSQHGNIYCKFGAASNFCLQGYMDQYTKPEAGTSVAKCKWDVNKLTKEYLFNMWHQKYTGGCDSQRVCRIHCHICMIFRLGLKLVCSLCQGLYLHSGCQSRGCKNSGSFRVKAHAVVLVDDGTSQASVKLFVDKLVQKLLTLSDEQWTDLVSVVQNTGEILISRYEHSESYGLPIEKFVFHLVQSPLVIRSCFMAVRCTKDSPNRATVDKMSLQDFKTKDINSGKSCVSVLQLPLMQLECLDLKEAPK